MKLQNNKKGSISIMGIIIALILVTVITGFMNVLASSYVYNEVQSIMDLSSINAMQYSIEDEALKREILGVENPSGQLEDDTIIHSDGTFNNKVIQSKINQTLLKYYRRELSNQIKSNSLIKNYKIVNCNGELEYDSWGANYNGQKKQRPQLSFNSVVQVTIKSDKEFDTVDNYSLKLFNARNKGTINISVDGKTADGNLVLTIRTLSRLIYK